MFWRAVNRKEKYDAVSQTFRQSTTRGPHSARPQSLNGLHTGHGVKVKHKICGAFFFFPNAFFLFYVHKCGPKYMRGIASESSDCSLANLATLFFPPNSSSNYYSKKETSKNDISDTTCDNMCHLTYDLVLTLNFQIRHLF